MSDMPVFTHDCGELIVKNGTITTECGCEFLGTITASPGGLWPSGPCDVWVHTYTYGGECEPSVIMRYSDEESWYSSGPLSIAIDWAEISPEWWGRGIALVQQKKPHLMNP